MGTRVTANSSDEALLGAVAAGDRAALRLLHERHEPWLTLRLARRCADPDAVDDAVQDTFGACGGRRRATRATARSAWIWGSAIRRLIDALRRRAVVRATILDGLTTPEASRLLGIPPGTLKTRAMRARQQLRAEMVV